MTRKRADSLAPLVTDCGDANELARLMGVHPVTLSKWRSGARPMPDAARQHANLLAFARRVAIPFPETLPEEKTMTAKPKPVSKKAIRDLAPGAFRDVNTYDDTTHGGTSYLRLEIALTKSGAAAWASDAGWRDGLRHDFARLGFDYVELRDPPKRTTGEIGTVVAEWWTNPEHTNRARP